MVIYRQFVVVIQIKKQEKNSCNFYFQVTHPEALGHSFVNNQNQGANVKTVLDDILKEGNEACLLPGELEYKASLKSDEAKGLIFTSSEKIAFDELAKENELELLNFEEYKN